MAKPTNNAMIEEIEAIDQDKKKLLKTVNKNAVRSKLDKYTILQMTYNTTELKCGYEPWWLKKGPHGESIQH